MLNISYLGMGLWGCDSHHLPLVICSADVYAEGKVCQWRGREIWGSYWFIIIETSVRNESFNKYILTIHAEHFKYLFLGGAKSQTGVCVKYNGAYM